MGYRPWGDKESDMPECTHTHVCRHTCTHTHTHNGGKSNHEEKITRATKARKELMGKKIYGRAPLEERISSC